VNSITFPEGILQQPFFDINNPASLNYGAVGTVSGHELNHGFDDQGIQFNAVGGLEQWMTNASLAGFKQMAKCVVDEYDGFCPLDKSMYTPNCIDGANTQGENIADNGGIHAAYRAYRIHVNLNGPDPRLPDPLFGLFTHDQLFFLTYAQNWCTAPQSPAEIYTSILTDVHSPIYLRVIGVLQNYPAFRTAFNCPLNSVYAPAKHCNVWVPDQTN
jgi:predicted metalloendopeptidase